MVGLEYLKNFNIILSAAVIVVTFFRFCKLSPVLGYFVAGATITKFVPRGEGMDLFAELGIVFLLFLIGLELTIDRLMSMKKYVFGFGMLQFLITAAVLFFLSKVLFSQDSTTSFIIGVALALSSTAIVLQVIQESGRQSTYDGRLSLATLLFQDLVVVPLLVLIPLLKGSPPFSEFAATITMSMLKGLVAVFVILVVGRLALRPMFRAISSLKSHELFISTTLLLILSLSYITHELGLSMALGAFLGGLLVAETEYRDEVEQVVLPFKSLLLGLFFMTVGMSVNFDALNSYMGEILMISFVLIAIKGLIIFILSLLFKIKLAVGIRVSFLLAQGGEFAFILFGLAMDKGIINQTLTEKLMLFVTFTMAVTPLLAILGNQIAKLVDKKPDVPKKINAPVKEDHIIIVGFGLVGRKTAEILTNASVPYIAIDINSEITTEYSKEGLPVFRGDSTKEAIYELVFAKNAKAIVVTMVNSVTVQKTLNTIKNYTNGLENVIVTTSGFENIEFIKGLNKNFILSDKLEIGLTISEILFRNFCEMSEDEVNSIINKYRIDIYKDLKCKS